MTTDKRKKSTSAPASAPAQAPAAHDNLWLAGLGALAQAQARGSEAFDALVREGMAQQAKAREAAEAELAKATERIKTMTESATASAPWDRLGGIFETRVGQALERIGMPAPATVHGLTERIDALEARLAKLEQHTGAATSAKAGTRSKPRANEK